MRNCHCFVLPYLVTPTIYIVYFFFSINIYSLIWIFPNLTCSIISSILILSGVAGLDRLSLFIVAINVLVHNHLDLKNCYFERNDQSWISWLKEIYNTACCQYEVYQIIHTYCIENVCLYGEVKNKRIAKKMYRITYR